MQRTRAVVEPPLRMPRARHHVRAAALGARHHRARRARGVAGGQSRDDREPGPGGVGVVFPVAILSLSGIAPVGEGLILQKAMRRLVSDTSPIQP